LALTHCDRCQFKMPVSKVRRDGDNPALMVCADCYDSIDPWKLAPPTVENYAIAGASPNTLILPPAPPASLLGVSAAPISGSSISGQG
jgi:hypothetical protein